MPHIFVAAWAWCMASPMHASIASWALLTGAGTARACALKIKPEILAWEARYPRVQAIAALCESAGTRIWPSLRALWAFVTGALLIRATGGAAATLPALSSSASGQLGAAPPPTGSNEPPPVATDPGAAAAQITNEPAPR